MRMIARDKDRDVERARSLANAAEGSSDPRADPGGEEARAGGDEEETKRRRRRRRRRAFSRAAASAFAAFAARGSLDRHATHRLFLRLRRNRSNAAHEQTGR